MCLLLLEMFFFYYLNDLVPEMIKETIQKKLYI